MPKFILRVDDVGQAVDQSKPDVGLKYFRRWWDAGEWEGLPVYLGVVIKPLGMWEEADYLNFRAEFGYGPYDWLFDHVKLPAEIALHGWDHADKLLELEDIYLSEESFPEARCVIPPYNKYNQATFDAMRQTNKTVLFGGFDGEHHNYGEAPRIVNGVLHLSAVRSLYAHSYLIADRISAFDDWDDFPLVVTLHHRWDENFLNGVKKLRDLIADKLVTVDEAWQWAETYEKK